jgi:hypothetical protein
MNYLILEMINRWTMEMERKEKLKKTHSSYFLMMVPDLYRIQI